MNGCRTDYTGARALRTFEHLGETFTVVRWRDHDGKHWRKYTALLHKGLWVADDITRNCDDAEEPWEATMKRRITTVGSLLAGLKDVAAMRA